MTRRGARRAQVNRVFNNYLEQLQALPCPLPLPVSLLYTPYLPPCPPLLPERSGCEGARPPPLSGPAALLHAPQLFIVIYH